MSILTDKQFTEALSAGLDLFELPLYQTNILQHYYVNVRPLSVQTDSSPVKFLISGAGRDYIDLNKTRLVMIKRKHRHDLEKNGYTVVKAVLRSTEADRYRKDYEEWLKTFTDQGKWPHSDQSMVQHYRIGHSEPSWAIRLKVKPVFSSLWGTERLLTSFDAVAIGRPPEKGKEAFGLPGKHWLHSDQGRRRMGLHAYQGALYLEDCDEDDWAFEVMEGSHRYFASYYTDNNIARQRVDKDPTWRLRQLTDDDVDWYKRQGCPRKKVVVPKGGMILWDSRLIHANCRPRRGRNHADRWRYVVFVCMAPAAWSDEESMAAKRSLYSELKMTTHWPWNCIKDIEKRKPFPNTAVQYSEVSIQTELPPSACTRAAQKLAGVLPYRWPPGGEKGVMERPKLMDIPTSAPLKRTKKEGDEITAMKAAKKYKKD